MKSAKAIHEFIYFGCLAMLAPLACIFLFAAFWGLATQDYTQLGEFSLLIVLMPSAWLLILRFSAKTVLARIKKQQSIRDLVLAEVILLLLPFPYIAILSIINVI